MKHNYINEIQPGQTINDVYMIKDPILRSTTRGDLYIAMYILDRTGQLNGRMWQASEQTYNMLPKPGFVHIQGRSELYQNNLQIVVNNIAVIDIEKVDLEVFLPRTTKDVEKLFAEIKSMLAKVAHPQMKLICEAFLADQILMKNFKTAPAAMSMHHNYLGGLIEHTHNMMRVATAILPLYPDVNGDLVLTGILLHDLGKTEELSYDMAFSYTDSGQLVGHITKTAIMLQQKADALADKGKTINSDIIDALTHIILSHHGKYEFGSPKLPATPEAFMVNYIDDLDAKMNQVTDAILNDPGDDNWTAYYRSLETKLYRKRI